MSEHTEGRRLPETWEEYDRAVKLRERAAFEKGAIYWASGYIGDPATEATFRYPITRRVPRTATLAGGGIVRAESDGFLRFEDPNGNPLPLTCIGSASVDALRDLLNRPYDEVPE